MLFHGQQLLSFLIGAETRIKAAEFWLSSGATAQEIETRLLDQESSKLDALTQTMDTGGI